MILILTCGLSVSALAEAGVVWHVDCASGNDGNDGQTRPTAFATIQRGIDSAADGDVVLVWPGVYIDPVNFIGRAITVKSADYPAVIETPFGDAVTFHSGEGPGSVLRNFVITGSMVAVSANYGSSPTLTNLTIADNEFGIVAYEDAQPDITNCILWDNADGDLFGCTAKHSWVQQEIEEAPDEIDALLISHWKFDDGAGAVAVDSVAANNAAVYGAQWTQGKIDQALSFDGIDDYVGIPDSDTLDFDTDDMSISMWFRTNRYADQTLMRFRQYDDDPHLEIYTSTTYGNLGTRAMPGNAIIAYNAGRVDDGAWHHVAVSLQNGTSGGYELFLDGISVGAATLTGQLKDWVSITVGNNGHSDGYFQGEIDDVRVYASVLTASQVHVLHKMSAAPMGHWRFDETSGGIAEDSVGGRDGIVHGAAWTPGKCAGSLYFDGIDDYVELPDNDPIWLPQNNFTISTWVWFAVTPDFVSNEMILDLNFAASIYPENEQGICVILHEEPYGKLGFQMATTTTENEALHVDNAFVGSQWYHIVAVRNATTQAMYIDGQLSNSRVCSSDPISFVGGYDDNKVSVGRFTRAGAYTPNTFYFNGRIDDVRIYDRALSDMEISELYAWQPGADASPLFADSTAGDYHLQSERGRYWPEHNVWVLDNVTSPCIDTADPDLNPSPEPMPNGARLNMGAYGGSPYASMSEWPLRHDENHDGRLDFADLAGFCDEWLLILPWSQ